MFDFNNLPQPVLDLLQTAKHALDFANKNIDQMISHSPYIEKASRFFSRFAGEKGIEELSKIFDRINTWFKAHIGFTFSEILKAIGRAFIWILEKITSFLKGIIK